MPGKGDVMRVVLLELCASSPDARGTGSQRVIGRTLDTRPPTEPATEAPPPAPPRTQAGNRQVFIIDTDGILLLDPSPAQHGQHSCRDRTRFFGSERSR